jgi:hypothetical protein
VVVEEIGRADEVGEDVVPVEAHDRHELPRQAIAPPFVIESQRCRRRRRGANTSGISTPESRS